MSRMRGVSKMRGQLKNFLHQVLGLGARNQHIARDTKGQAVELGFAGDVLDGLAVAAALEQRGIEPLPCSGQFVIEMGQEPGFVFA